MTANTLSRGEPSDRIKLMKKELVLISFFSVALLLIAGFIFSKKQKEIKKPETISVLTPTTTYMEDLGFPTNPPVTILPKPSIFEDDFNETEPSSSY